MPTFANLEKHIKWALSCLVFFALPFILIAYSFGKHWEVQEKESIDYKFKKLDNLLVSLRRREDAEEYLSDLLNKLFEMTEKSSQPANLLSRGIKNLKRRFPGVFLFTILDEKGLAIQSLTDFKTSPRVISRLFQCVRLILEERDEKTEFFLNSMRGLHPPAIKRKKIVETMEIYWPILRPFVGHEATWEFFRRKYRRLFEASLLEEKRRFYYNCSADWGMFVHANYTPDWPILALRDQCSQFMKYRQKFEISVGVDDSSFFNPASISYELATALGEFKHSTQPHFQGENSLISIMGVSNNACIWASLPRSKCLNRNDFRYLLMILGMIPFSALSWVSYQIMIIERKIFFPIRWRLVLLFGFAGGMPLVVIVSVGLDYLHQKYETRVRQAHEEAERALKSFDVRFPQMRGQLQRKINHWITELRYDTPGARKSAHVRLKDIFNRFECSNINIFDKKGRSIWSAYEYDELGPGEKIIGGVIRNVIADLNNEEQDAPVDMASIALESIAKLGNQVSDLIRNMNQIMNFGILESQNWLLMKTLQGSNAKISHMIAIFWSSSEMEKLYITQELLSTQRALPGVLLLATNIGRRERSYPEDFRYFNRLGRFIDSLKLRGTTTYDDITIGKGKYLITGIKPKELSRIYLIAMQSDEPINLDISILKHRLGIFCFLSIAINFFLGLILSQRFLKPINHLSSGVEAIQKRDFRHRIPVGEPDELGQLSQTYNKMMEGLSDLEIGRIVQESLFPAGEQKVGEFRLFGMTKSATQLGGDYFDLQPLSDGRMLILIGDVSGHGVPAALVMAMAKALVERESEDSLSPEQILCTLNRILFRTLKRLRMMTCFLGILDPTKNILVASNAGHNDPFLFRVSAQPSPIVIRSFPLGIRKNSEYFCENIEIKKGDRIIFYTDGLIEAEVADNPIGYDVMLAGVNELIEDDPRASCEKIFAWHSSLCRQTPQNDDITVVILTRQS